MWRDFVIERWIDEILIDGGTSWQHHSSESNDMLDIVPDWAPNSLRRPGIPFLESEMRKP
jgi:hypothetical protein